MTDKKPPPEDVTDFLDGYPLRWRWVIEQLIQRGRVTPHDLAEILEEEKSS